MIDLFFLIKQSKGYPIEHSKQKAFCDQVCIDSRAITSPNALFVALAGSRSDGHNFLSDAQDKGAQFALVSKAYKNTTLFHRLLLIPVEDPLRALQQLAHHHRVANRAKIIAITGSSGKTQLKDLLYHILKINFRSCCSAESYNSQIGVALSLLRIKPRDEVAIIECGISKVCEMRVLADLVCPDFAILTNIEDKYGQTLDSLSSVYLEKSQLLSAVPNQGWSLVPKSAVEFLVQRKFEVPFNWKIWDEDERANFSDATKHPHLSKELVQMATRAAQLLGISQPDIAKRVLSHRPQALQLEMWRAFSGPTFVNDLYCADFASLGKTIDWAHLFAPKGGKKILWLNGIKGCRINQRHKKLQRLIGQFGIDEVYWGNPLSMKGEKNNLMALCTSLGEHDLLIFRGARKQNFLQLARQIGSPLPPAVLKIDLTAIAQNVKLIRKTLSSTTTVMAMLKAQAYGTDGVIMARFLTRCGIEHFGLATVDEAISLRKSGVFGHLLVLHAAPMQWDLAIEHDLQICVSKKKEICGLAKCAIRAKKVAKLHLHIDVGMCRLGCSPAQALSLATLIANHPHLQLEGVMGHLASADEPDQFDFTKRQCDIFETILSSLRRADIDFRYSHLANSAGAFNMQNSSCNLIRIGLGLFGLTRPNLHHHLLLKPALSLNAAIAHLHTIKRGQSVSYGRKYFAEREKERIAVIPIGYADGLRRDFGRASVMVKGQIAPIVGAVCMDFTMCDVTHIAGVKAGDRALIFGSGNPCDRPIHQLARDLGISVHEIIATLGPRIQRLFYFDQKPVAP